jgi:hypothetical protein
MAIVKKTPSKKASKVEVNKKIQDELSIVLNNYKKQFVDEKAFEKKIKKLTRIFLKGFNKSVVKDTTTATPAKKAALMKNTKKA